ncbi:YceI family protein [Fulvivirga lutimaris]|uniref:YceI family protein n=1 Tax=Fulvivirga lutimaris TaxID=1819566 RepID=UPI0012BBC37A|nr:YceI family protein [Fulvivirga lutimaris]MTI38391.1 YceI family protein [Fulvivirga lutimaris]
MKKLVLIIFIMSAIAPRIVAQKYSLSSKESKLEVLGTSTLHDWEEVAEEMSGDAVISLENDQISIETLKFSVPVKALKSDHGAMDKNTYEALKSSKHPNIYYELKEVKSIEKNGQDYSLKTSGNLTIAGVTKNIEMTVTSKPVGNTISFSGKVDFKMTDFKVDPPTALLGTVKTGDEITIQFNVKYNK